MTSELTATIPLLRVEATETEQVLAARLVTRYALDERDRADLLGCLGLAA